MTTNNNTARDLLARAADLLGSDIVFPIVSLRLADEIRAYLASSATDAQAVANPAAADGLLRELEIAASNARDTPCRCSDDVPDDVDADEWVVPVCSRCQVVARIDRAIALRAAANVSKPAGGDVPVNPQQLASWLTAGFAHIGVDTCSDEILRVVEGCLPELYAAPPPQQAAPEGWVLVPRKRPTDAALHKLVAHFAREGDAVGRECIVEWWQILLTAMGSTVAPFDTSSPCGDPGVKVLSRDAVTGEPRMTMRREG